jgi:hypothetical protein
VLSGFVSQGFALNGLRQRKMGFRLGSEIQKYTKSACSEIKKRIQEEKKKMKTKFETDAA